MNPSVSIIDDDEDVLLAVSSLIRALGWQVRLFSSAGEFLRSDAIRDTGCIVCDIHMPDMSGIEMQDVLRANGSRVPIIFITASPSTFELERRASSVGAVGVLRKPVDGQAIYTVLSRLIGRASQE
jgi:FixJ family two-component response regulator